VSAEVTLPLTLLTTSNRKLVFTGLDILINLNFKFSYFSFVEVKFVEMMKIQVIWPAKIRFHRESSAAEAFKIILKRHHKNAIVRGGYAELLSQLRGPDS